MTDEQRKGPNPRREDEMGGRKPAAEEHHEGEPNQEGPIRGTSKAKDAEKAADIRGEHPSIPTEGPPDDIAETSIEDPHGEHPIEPSEGPRNAPRPGRER